MQETRNNCFESKICSMTLCQAKTSKHECQNVRAIYVAVISHWFNTRAYLFSPDKGSGNLFSTQNNCCQFLASYGVVIQSVTQSFLKTPVCGASLTCTSKALIWIHNLHSLKLNFDNIHFWIFLSISYFYTKEKASFFCNIYFYKLSISK